ncbi:MAG: hypothetical protein AAB503_02485 [Patescibacteria group bacterium]
MKTSILKIIASGVLFALFSTSFFFVLPQTQYAYAVGESDVPESGLTSGGESGTGSPATESAEPSKKVCFIGAGLDVLIKFGVGKITNWAKSFLGLGTKVPTDDLSAQGLITTNTIAACVREVLAKAAKIAYLKFKKRLLDRVTNDTVAWINGTFPKGSPKFVTNFGDVLKEAGDAAIGDTLIQLGAGDLCYGLRFDLNLRLQQPPQFNEAVNCTLSRVIDNVEAFRDDFTQGGWLGYYETLKPQNNPVGLAYMTNEYMVESRKKQEREAELKISNGFKSDEYCEEWILYAYIDEAKKDVTVKKLDINKYPDPYKKIIVNKQKGDSYEYNANRDGIIPPNAEGPQWECNSKKIGTPASTIAAVGIKALTSDTDYLINADDLTPYINAIFDSATNRLIKVGVKGLRSKMSDLSSKKDYEARKPIDPNKPDPRNTVTEEIKGAYAGAINTTELGEEGYVDLPPPPSLPMPDVENSSNNEGVGYNTQDAASTDALRLEVQTLISKEFSPRGYESNYDSIPYKLNQCQLLAFNGGCETTKKALKNTFSSIDSKNIQIPQMSYKELIDLKTTLTSMNENFTKELSSCRASGNDYKCPAQ